MKTAIYYRRIFASNIYLISISNSVSDGAMKTLVLTIERAQINCPKEFELDVLSTFLFDLGFKTQNFTMNVSAH